jgi:hypothetical protein
VELDATANLVVSSALEEKRLIIHGPELYYKQKLILLN